MYIGVTRRAGQNTDPRDADYRDREVRHGLGYNPGSAMRGGDLHTATDGLTPTVRQKVVCVFSDFCCTKVEPDATPRS